ncbi:MAG: J domain-containing protein [Clostridia bacterium]|nr:J domain-containing protein [Clostridia bacterium]
MISDPWKILGVPQSATQEEIKKAYRQKAKTCHPDLHPDDPDAPRRMNELNEAYDLCMHPEKIQQQQSPFQGNPYQGSPFQGNPFQGYSGQQGGTYYYYGPMGGFDPFGDMYGQQQIPEEPQDTPVMREAVAAINMGKYQTAIELLTVMAPSSRNARWYYLTALAHKGAGNKVMAMDAIKHAVELDGNNQTYRNLQQQLSGSAQTYRQNGTGYNMYSNGMGSLCSSVCGVCMLTNMLRCCCLPC